MKRFLFPCLTCLVCVASLLAQDTEKKVQAQKSVQAEDHAQPTQADSEDMQQLKGDLQRMKVLVNQMRTNLAFVQTSQTPLKHQFELEADAWQVMVDEMDRRVRRMEKGNPRTSVP